MRRALLVIGAGASLDYGAPSTWHTTQSIRKSVYSDRFMKAMKSDRAYASISRQLASYLGGKSAVNFEQIFHCAHELVFTYPPVGGAVNEYKPILLPFIRNTSNLQQNALRPLTEHIIRRLYDVFSLASNSPAKNLHSLREFISGLRKNYVTRIYTTNYDDFILKANPDLYYGYSSAPSTNPKQFNPANFWAMRDHSCVTHLHGSIHMGFPHPSRGGEMAELSWYDDLQEAKRNAIFTGGAGSSRRMDGSEYRPTSIVTGLDKTSSIQQSPYLHFYSGLGYDSSAADLIYVIGSGLTDLHINSWLREARNRSPRPPIIFVDFWRNGLARALNGDWDRKIIEMVHALKIPVGPGTVHRQIGPNWTMVDDCAVWDGGFSNFLDDPNSHAQVLRDLARLP